MANPPVATPDYSGLQTVDDPGLEVHPQHGHLYCPYPEVNTAPEKAPEAAYPTAYPPAYSGVVQVEKYPLAADSYAVPPAEAKQPPKPTKYSRRCKVLALIGVIAVVIIAIVVGCVVGLVVIPGSKS